MVNFQTTALRSRTRQRLSLFLSILLLGISAGIQPVNCQTTANTGATRKVLSRVEPDYPETLKRMYIGRVVRVEVVVTPNGTVESAQVLGGNPILGQSAIKAVKRWKYAPATAKEKLVVKFDFDPHGN